MASTATTRPRTGARVHVQKFGTFLSNMIMPNIPRPHRLGPDHRPVHRRGLAAERDRSPRWSARRSTTCCPILIAATGGRMVYGDRGAVVGAFATMGVIAGSTC